MATVMVGGDSAPWTQFSRAHEAKRTNHLESLGDIASLLGGTAEKPNKWNSFSMDEEGRQGLSTSPTARGSPWQMAVFVINQYLLISEYGQEVVP